MVGRPQPQEAAPYFFKYIDLIPGDDPLTHIESQLEQSRAWLAGISEEGSRYRYAPDKWSVRQVLNHVTDTERAFAFRALWFGRGFTTPLASYDQNVAAAGAEADAVAWSAHVEEFRAVRLASICLFRNMPPEGWVRQGVASGNPVTVRALAYIIAGHFAHHMEVLRDRYNLG